MSWKQRTDIGLDLVHQVHDLLRIDEAWQVDEGNGFIYWTSDLAQHIWSEPGVYHNAQTMFRLHAETDLLMGKGRPAAYEVLVEREMDAASFSAAVYDKDRDMFRMHTSCYLTEENAPWLRKLFFAAVALQNAEAHKIGPNLAAITHGSAATSGHPIRGIRPTPDPNLKQVYTFFTPTGRLPSKWLNAFEWQSMERTMEREAARFLCDHHSHLKAEFDWACGSSDHRLVLEITADEPHELMGNGLHFTLTVPLKMSEDHVARLALELNLRERNEYHRCHMLGSWCDHEGILAFRCFVPNAVYHPDILPQLALSMAVRAQWVNEVFMEKKQAAMAAH